MSNTEMTVVTVLDEARDTVMSKRAGQYGQDSRTEMHMRIAQGWTGILNKEVTPQEVALCMAYLKLVRAQSAPNHGDSYVDACGYVGIAAELIGTRTDVNGESVLEDNVIGLPFADRQKASIYNITKKEPQS